MIFKHRFLQSHCVLLFLAYFPVAGHATSVSYDVTTISGNTWEYTYNIENDTLDLDIEEFTIWFDFNTYENLSIVSAPLDWDPIVIEPSITIPDDGFYDALALSAGIAPGDFLGGFTVQFDYLLAGTPGSQFFEIIDPSTFNALDSGMTQTSVVPVPASVWLFISGFLTIFGVVKRSKISV